MLKRPGSYRIPIIIAFCVLYILASVYVMWSFCLITRLGDYWSETTLISMVNMSGLRPFVYRALVPAIIQFAMDVTPLHLQEKINMALQYSAFMRSFGSDAGTADVLKEHSYLFMRATMIVLDYLCLVGYMASLYKIAKFLYPRQWAMALFSPVIGMLMIPAFTYPTYYVYDFSVLLLDAAAYYCMLKERWFLYLVLLFFATLNKETAIYLVVFYSLWFFWRYDTWRFIRLWVPQCAIYICAKVAINLYFLKNPGDVLVYNPHPQIKDLTGGYSLSVLVTDALAVFLVLHHWSRKPLFARYSLWLFPLMLLAYIMFGFPGEYRVFFDLFPLLTILITDTLVMSTDVHKLAIFHPAPAPAREPAGDAKLALP